MLLPNNLKQLIESLESLVQLSRCNSALKHLPIDELLKTILGGNFSKALKSFEYLVEPIREKSPEAAEDLTKIINQELPLAKSLPRMLECLSHVYPNTAESIRMHVEETDNGWILSEDDNNKL